MLGGGQATSCSAAMTPRSVSKNGLSLEVMWTFLAPPATILYDMLRQWLSSWDVGALAGALPTACFAALVARRAYLLPRLLG